MKTFRLNGTAMAVSVAIALSYGSSPVVAQGFVLEEVVVTARKKEESLQDVPVAVNAFSANDLKALNLTDTGQLGAFSPGVNIEPPASQGGTSTRVTIRGQMQSDNLITVDPSVGWYIDDIYLARTYGTAISMFDVERVEVLKGPQGTLYGRNTTGGAIKLMTTKAEPSGPLSGYITGGLGNFEQYKVGGAVNIPLIEDKLAVRLSGVKDENKKGYGELSVYGLDSAGVVATSPKKEDWGTKDNELIRVGVTFLPSDALSIFMNYEHSESRVTSISYNTSVDPGFQGDLPTYAGGGTSIVPPIKAAGPFKRSSSDHWDGALNQLPWAEAESDTVSLAFEYNINDNLDTKLVYGWRDTKNSYQADIDGTAYNFASFAKPFVSGAEQHSLEWQLTGSAFNGAVDWITGLYWFTEDGYDVSTSSTFSTPGASTSFDASAENDSESAFVSATYHVTDTINLTAGVRYTHDEKSITSGLTASDGTCLSSDPTLPNLNLTGCNWGDDDSYYFISYNAGVDWAINDDAMVYLKTSSASRSGGQNLRAQDAATAQPFQEETATDYELGLKSQLFNGRLQLNAALYHTDYEDVQQTEFHIVNNISITTVVNQGEADIDGFEMDFKWLPTDNLMVTGSAGLLNWKFKDPDSILPSAPEKEMSLRVNYFVPSDLGSFNFDVNYSYRGDMISNVSNGRPDVRQHPAINVDSVGLLGARVTLDLAATDMSISLWANNLTNEEYYLSGLGIYQAAGPGAVWGSSNSGVGAPRTFGIEATYNF
jgi:iron complex outermembrane receptor protein